MINKYSMFQQYRLALILAALLGLVMGVVSLLLSPLWVLAGLAGGGLVYAILKRPEVGLLCILIATSTIVFENRLPLISTGVGSLHIPDILLLILVGLIFLRWLVEPDFKIVRTPLNWPLLMFLGVAIITTVIAIFRSSVDLWEARRQIRGVSYFLTFFVVTNLVLQVRQLRFLVNGILFLATIVAAVMIAQFIVGELGATIARHSCESYGIGRCSCWYNKNNPTRAFADYCLIYYYVFDSRYDHFQT